jgi:hypothetical protein
MGVVRGSQLSAKSAKRVLSAPGADGPEAGLRFSCPTPSPRRGRGPRARPQSSRRPLWRNRGVPRRGRRGGRGSGPHPAASPGARVGPTRRDPSYFVRPDAGKFVTFLGGAQGCPGRPSRGGGALLHRPRSPRVPFGRPPHTHPEVKSCCTLSSRSRRVSSIAAAASPFLRPLQQPPPPPPPLSVSHACPRTCHRSPALPPAPPPARPSPRSSRAFLPRSAPAGQASLPRPRRPRALAPPPPRARPAQPQ